MHSQLKSLPSNFTPPIRSFNLRFFIRFYIHHKALQVNIVDCNGPTSVLRDKRENHTSDESTHVCHLAMFILDWQGDQGPSLFVSVKFKMLGL